MPFLPRKCKRSGRSAPPNVSAEHGYCRGANRRYDLTTPVAYVLVVDDEESIRKLLMRWLVGWGYESKEAASANDALELMSADPASIILCDVMMPVHDGIWLTEQVRQRWPKTAVVMASSAQDMETVMRMRKQGAVDYITKPFGREMLRQALLRASALLEP
jgi:CheY-like chemotaxis protein